MRPLKVGTPLNESISAFSVTRVAEYKDDESKFNILF
jgi:hypothetical protein